MSSELQQELNTEEPSVVYHSKVVLASQITSLTFFIGYFLVENNNNVLFLYGLHKQDTMC